MGRMRIDEDLLLASGDGDLVLPMGYRFWHLYTYING